jgi:hypothetical protein
MTPVFFSVTTVTVVMKFTYIVSIHALQIWHYISTKSSSLPPHFFPPLLAILYASRVKLFAESSELFTHTLFQLVIVYKMASLECILQGAKKMAVGGG